MATTKTDLVVGLVLLDKFSKTFDKFQGEMDKGQAKAQTFGSSLKSSLGGAAAALSIGAVTAFGVSAVKAYGDAMQSQQLLMDAFARQPQLVGYNVDALMAWNKELSTKIAYDDDEINKAQANLALFKLTGDQIKGLTPLVADLARRKGIDLAEAATSVGKAMQGQARGLKDLGIQFKATGNTVDDYANLTALLNQQVGGTAQAFAQGNPLGQMQNMQIAFQNMQESLGQALVPAMTAFTNVMTPFANLVSSIPGPVMQIAVTFGLVSLAVRTTIPAILGFVSAQRAQRLAANEAAAAEARKAAATTGGAIATNAAAAASRGLTGAMTAAAAAGRGLMAALGGPIGIAIIGITTAISLFSMKSDEAATSSDNWTESIIRQNGVLDENSKRLIAQKLAELGVADALSRAGVSMDAFGAALAGSEQDRMAMIAQLKQIIYAHSGLGADGQMQYDMIATSAQKALDVLIEYGPQIGDNNTLTGEAGALYASLGGAIDSSTESLQGYTRALSETAVQSGVLSKATNDLLFQFFMPTRNPGESIESWAARVEEYRQTMTGTLPVIDAAASATEDMAIATEKLSKPQQKMLDTVRASRAALAGLVQDRRQFISDVTASGMDFGTVLGMTPADAASAADAWKSAQSDVVKAQADMASVKPGDIEGRARAQQALNDAIAKEGEAKKAADAAAYTPENIKASYQSKFTKLKGFADDIAKLTDAGVPQIILQDILAAGIDGGGDMAHMLATHPGLLKSLKGTAAGIENQSARAATIAGNFLYSGAITGAQSTYRADFNAADRAGVFGPNAQPIEVTLKLDTATVYKQMLRLRRERGGASLGL